MTTHLTAQQMQNYLVRRLSIDELGRMGEHLHGCRSCYQAYLSVLQTRFSIEIDFDELGGLKDWHLEGEELANYLDGRMTQVDLDYARLHLHECGSCEQRVYDSAKNWPEHAASREGRQENHEAPWGGYLPAFHSTLASRWRMAAVLLLVIGFSLALWAILYARPEKAVQSPRMNHRQLLPPRTLQDELLRHPEHRKAQVGITGLMIQHACR